MLIEQKQKQGQTMTREKSKRKLDGILFTSDWKGHLYEWDIDNQELVKSYTDIGCSTGIQYITSVNNGEFLFIGCFGGYFKQLSVKHKMIIKDYGRIYQEDISSIAISLDGENLFVSDVFGNLKQYSVKRQFMVKDYGIVHENGIISMITTIFGPFQYTGGKNGDLKKWHIATKEIVHEWKKAHSNGCGGVYSMVETNCGEFLFTSGFKNLKKWSIEQNSQVQDIKIAHFTSISAMAVSDTHLFTSDIDGYLKKWTLENFTKDAAECMGKVHKRSINSICVSKNGKYQFTSDNIGNLKQWCLPSIELKKNYGQVHDSEIFSIVSTISI